MPDVSGESGKASSLPPEMLGAVVETSFDAIVTVDDQGTVRTFNGAAERMFGFSAGEVVGRPIGVLVPALHENGQGLDAVGREVDGQCKDGSTVPVEMVITEFVVGGRRHFLAIMHDVGIRKVAGWSAEATRRLRGTFEGPLAFAGVLSIDGSIIELDARSLTVAGFGREAVIGTKVADTYWFSHSNTERRRIRHVLQRAKAGEAVREAFTIRVGDGRLVQVDLAFSPLRDSIGTVVLIVVAGVDTTARGAAADELRTRLRQQEAVAQFGLSALAAGHVGTALDAAVETVSRTLGNDFCKILELEDDGSFLLRAGVGWRDGLVGHARIEGGDSQAAYTIASDEPVIVDDLRNDTRFSGPPLLVEHGVVSGMSVTIHGEGRPYGVLGTHTRSPHTFCKDDLHFLQSVANIVAGVVRRTRAEARFRKEKTFSEALFESLPGIVCMCDARGGIVRWNRATEAVTGYSADEIRGMAMTDLFPERERRAVAATIESAFQLGQFVAEGNIRSKDGSESPYYFRGLRYATDSEAYCIGVGLDISERKRLEDQLRQSQKLEAIGQLAAGIAHDFNNLLTVISGQSEMLLAELPQDDPSRGSLEDVREAGRRATSLTRRLLTFSRQSVLSPRVVNVNTIVEDMEAMLRPLIREDVRLETVLDTGLEPVKVDPGQLEQVLMNLAVNASDAMPMGGRLAIETRNVMLDEHHAGSTLGSRTRRYALLEVNDTGCGMSAAVKARAFEPFFTTKSVGKGTGLGLAVVHGIVTQNGGHIELDSEPGRGTSIRLYFPTVHRAAVADSPAVSSNEKVAAETILLAEDEDGVRGLLSSALRAQGYDVLAASNGVEALRIAEAHAGPLDLLVTDVVMPMLDGRRLADALRSRFPQTKVLYLSGYTEDASFQHGILSNDVAFLQKPVSPRDFVRAVSQILHQNA